MVSCPNQAGVYSLSIILIVASTIAIVLRYKARRIRAAPWKADDWLVSSAMVGRITRNTRRANRATQGTIGTHTMTDPETGAVIVTSHENQISMFGAISQILTVIALGTLKFGVVMFYRRIFIGDWFKRLSIAMLVLITLWSVAFFFATIFQCNGLNLDLMLKSIQTFKDICCKYKDIQLAHCVSDVATDILVLSMPLPEIWKLRMTTRQKIVISLIFLIGLLYVYSSGHGTACVETNVLVWSYVEVGVGVVAACLPTLKPIFDERSLDSIVASVRSKVSLRSLNSNSRDRKPSNGGPNGSNDLEMFPFDALNHTYNEISGSDGVHKLPAQSTNAILREDDWAVKTERAESHAI
ncbi:hypothetical protein F5Y04DRAFT_280856 [Hypomontagnella monticulosa]|nr:hypothetical protein F5Y04DRAFT_280856 [Hypomontagnella monticulosa]